MTKSLQLLLITLVFLGSFFPLQAEKVSIKFSFSINSEKKSDIHTWINSINSLWTDWGQYIGGNLTGRFNQVEIGSFYEMELRIPVFKFLAFNIIGTQVVSDAEDTVMLTTNTIFHQEEKHTIHNRITAYPLKLGLSLMYQFSNFNFFIQGGRHIVFFNYSMQERYDAYFTFPQELFNYWYERNESYETRLIGTYITAGIELNAAEKLALVIEAEQVWSSSWRLSGSGTFNDYKDNNHSGNLILYIYETYQGDLDQYFWKLAGHENIPQGTMIRNARESVISYTGFSIKIGLRFKF